MKKHVALSSGDKWWMFANAIGAASYLWLASRIWVEPELKGETVARSGDAIIWGMTALPLLLAFALANFVWSWGRQGSAGRQPEVLIIAMWALVLIADRLLS